MKLKVFNQSNSVSQRLTEAGININQIGVISLNREAVKLMGLTEKSTVVIHQNEDDQSEFYLQANPKKDGIALRKSAGKTEGSLVFQSALISKNILSGYHEDKRLTSPSSIFMPLAKEVQKVGGLELWPLLRSGAKETGRLENRSGNQTQTKTGSRKFTVND